MTPDRWEQISRVYYATLKVAEKERAAFIEKACDKDVELRREVESLLATHRETGDFSIKPAVEGVTQAVMEEPRSLIGRQLGPYQILGALGAGGMGEVYKAKDTRLNRTVAIKVLPRLLSERADLRQRFEREARAIASLNHPNICAVYDIGREGRIDFLVMEHLEGETLLQRLKKGPLPTEQLLRTAIEIATALDQAHRKGVVHRDLKPGNIMLTKAGVKLLDFGLAKQSVAASRSSALQADGMDGGPSSARPISPTESASLTEEGMILGTLEYMAPEQVEGKEMDARTDIFAFGVVLYEMATGRKTFAGNSRASLAVAILTSEPPPISTVQPLTPPALERVVKRCLAKDPEDRWQTARDLTLELKWIAEAGGAILETTAGAEAAGLKSMATGRRRERLAWALALTFLIAVIVSAVSYLRPARSPAQAIISEILPPEKAQFNFFGAGPPVLSPDGGAVAFSALDSSGKGMLWVHSLDSLSAQPLAGTEGGSMPFWSANGRALGFFADGKLKTLEVSGGPVTDVAAEIGSNWGGGSWSRQGTLLFVPDLIKGLDQVAASGGTPVSVLKVDSSKYNHYLNPKFLPDGKHFLYCGDAPDSFGGLYFASLDGKENRLLLQGVASASYASGFLLYLRGTTLGTTLMAQVFDPEQGQLKGDAHPVAERVGANGHAAGFFDVSENGVLIYQAGASLGEIRFYWFDRAGNKLGDSEVVGDWVLRLSPDGAKLALIMGGETHSDLWVDELARGVRMRLTNDPQTGKWFPVWSPDGSRILFAATAGKARLGIYQKNSNGAGGEELLLPAETSDPQIWPTSWSPDGRFILYGRGHVINQKQDLWVLPLAADRNSRLFIQNANDGQFSPDGRWVAYTSRESGKEQIYVVPFDATKILNSAPGAVTSPGGKWQISSGGGGGARWRRDGKEIFYLGPDSQMMAVEVEGRGDRFEARKAQALFRAQVVEVFSYDATPDGKRFVLSAQKVINPNAPLTLVVNWTAILGKKP